MPNARGEITTVEAARMRSLRKHRLYNREIAALIGCSVSTAQRHARAATKLKLSADERRERERLRREADRYLDFVERAACIGIPLLVSPSPF
jgi:hypothetical protein